MEKRQAEQRGLFMIDEEELLKIIHSYVRLRDVKIYFCRDFLIWFNRLTVSIDIVDYIDFVYQVTSKKKSNSFERLFIFLSTRSNVFDAYCSTHKAELKKQIIHINCPACGTPILQNENCPICELEVCHRREPDEIRFHKGWAKLKDEQRKSYETEMESILSTIPFLERDSRNKATYELKKKFNLID